MTPITDSLQWPLTPYTLWSCPFSYLIPTTFLPRSIVYHSPRFLKWPLHLLEHCLPVIFWSWLNKLPLYISNSLIYYTSWYMTYVCMYLLYIYVCMFLLYILYVCSVFATRLDSLWGLRPWVSFTTIHKTSE